jgi:hypothetical protein
MIKVYKRIQGRYMVPILSFLSLSVALVLAGYTIFSYKEFRKIIEEIEELKLENSKLSFRIFVAEKRQKVIDDRFQINN